VNRPNARCNNKDSLLTVCYWMWMKSGTRGLSICEDGHTFVMTVNETTTRVRRTLHMPFLGATQNCEKRLLVSSSLSVRPSSRMVQLSSYWTDFHEI